MKKFRISITSGMSGYFTVLLEYNDNDIPEIVLTGIGRYPDFEGALIKAQDWSRSDNISLDESLKTHINTKKLIKRKRIKS